MMTAKYKFAVIDPVEFEIKELRSIIEDKARLKDWKKEFWEKVEEQREKLSTANGVYCFVIKHGQNLKPWYVGKTVGKGGYKSECLTEHKLGLYARVAEKSGKAHMIFFPLMTAKGNFSKSGKSAIEELEKTLIARGIARNPDLLNTQGARLYENIFVPGLMGTQPPGPRNFEAKLARSIFEK